jgi:thiamine biosynthesis lipoprotein
MASRPARLAAALTAALLLMSACSRQPIRVEGFAMDTFITITVFDRSHVAAADKALALLDSYDREWSAHREGSAISLLNERGQATLHGDTAALLLTALDYAQQTEGAFDPTIYPLTALWRISTRRADEPLPDDDAIHAAKALVDYRAVSAKVSDEGLIVSLAPGMGIDFGAIAKGFAGDRLAAQLLESGVGDAILNLGGNVSLIGAKERTVGLSDPRGGANVFATLALRNVHVVTSGDYNRYLVVDGQRIHHIIDPSTGRSAANGLVSVTIIGTNGAQCDALSTAVFVLGAKRGLALAKTFGVDAVLVDDQGQVTLTEGIKGVFTLVNKAYRIL